MKAALLLLVLTACGTAPILQPGQYDVHLKITQSDWGLTGHETDTVWLVMENHGHYKLKTDPSNEWFMEGIEQEGNVLLIHFQELDDPTENCDDYNKLSLTITPAKKEFVGIAKSTLHVCNLSTCGYMEQLMGKDCQTVEGYIRETMDVTAKLKEEKDNELLLRQSTNYGVEAQ